MGDKYTRIALGPAVESAVDSLAWAFWQYGGVAQCPTVPAPTDTDSALWAFLDLWSPVNGSNDASVAQFEPYYFQSAWQLGFPVGDDSFLTPYLTYGAADYAGITPVGVVVPPYDPAPMADIADWVAHDADRIMFIYGQFDPWSGGAFDTSANPRLQKLIAPDGAHWSGLLDLATADRATAFAALTDWTGVVPDPSAVKNRARPPRARVPPAFLRMLRLRARP
jgi:hypothetical protein